MADVSMYMVQMLHTIGDRPMWAMSIAMHLIMIEQLLHELLATWLLGSESSQTGNAIIK